MTEVPLSLNYSSVVSRDSVRLAFLIEGLKKLDIMTCDVENTYLSAPCWERIWFAAGPEHGPEKTSQVMVMVRSLYGLNNSGASWRKMFTETLRDMDFVPKVDDPDIYHRRARNPDGEDYYDLLSVYVDDLLRCLHNPQLIMDALALPYDLKDGSVGLPTI